MVKAKHGGRKGSRVEVNLDEDDVKCPVCEKTEVQLECEVCLRWFHTDCADVSALKLEQIEKHDFHWYCHDCEVAAVEMHSKIKALQSENTELKMKVKNLTTKLTTLENKTTTLIDECEQKVSVKFAEERDTLKEEIKREIKEELKPVIIEEVVTEAQERSAADEEDGNTNAWNVAGRRKSTSPQLREIIQEEMVERREIDLRKMNLIISGIVESDSTEADLQKVKDLINTELHITAEIEKVVRCGKTKDDDPEKPRVIKMFMKTRDNRKDILINAKKLRDSDDEHTKFKIYISPDQTKKQQLKAKNLRDELKTKKLAHPGLRFKIDHQRGAIVELE